MEQLLMRLVDLPSPAAHQISSMQALYRVQCAQQGDHDCVVLFEPAPDLFQLLWRSRLSERGGHGERWAAVADRGARIPLKRIFPPSTTS